MGSCPDSCVRGLAKTTLESGFFKKTGFVWTDSLGTLTISADVFPVVAPEKLLFGWKDRTDDRKYVCVRKLVDGWLIRVKKKKKQYLVSKLSGLGVERSVGGWNKRR